MKAILDTGEVPLWRPAQREQLARCQSCERHPATQGHHGYCPEGSAGTPDLHTGLAAR